MKQQFEEYLKKRGYAKNTPSGRPSTVYNYPKRIDKVCEWERTTWAGNLGNKSKRAVINALNRFSEFLKER